MKFATQQDVKAPIDAVFKMVSSFEDYEDAARRHGADVKRTDDLASVGIGMKWNVRFVFKSQNRDLDVEITQFDPPKNIVLELDSQGLFGHARVDLETVSGKNTRITVNCEVQASTLKTRVLLQPLKLTKSTLDQRFEERVAKFIYSLEQRYQNRA